MVKQPSSVHSLSGALGKVAYKVHKFECYIHMLIDVFQVATRSVRILKIFTWRFV